MISVAVVDDHPMMRRMLCDVLMEQPVLQVIGEAPDGLAAIELVEQVHPDVVLIDAHMPGMNGIDTTRQIRALSSETVIIGMSSDSSPSMEREFLSAGAHAFLPKELMGKQVSAIIGRELSQ